MLTWRTAKARARVARAGNPCADRRSAATSAGELLRLGEPDSPLAAAIDLGEAHALAARIAVAWRGGRPATAAELSPLHTRESTDPLGGSTARSATPGSPSPSRSSSR